MPPRSASTCTPAPARDLEAEAGRRRPHGHGPAARHPSACAARLRGSRAEGAHERRPRAGLRRAAWLEIDLAALRHNVALIRSLVGPAAVVPVVKADAYGHGNPRTAEALAGVSDGLCVATLDEALALRAVLPATRLLLLYPVPAPGRGRGRRGRARADHHVGRGPRAPPTGGAARPAARRPAALRGDRPRSGRAAHRGPRRRGSSRGGRPALPAGRPLVPPGQPGRRHRLGPPGRALRAGPRPRSRRPASRHRRAIWPPVAALFAETAPPLELVRPGLAVYGVLDAGCPWPRRPPPRPRPAPRPEPEGARRGLRDVAAGEARGLRRTLACPAPQPRRHPARRLRRRLPARRPAGRRGAGARRRARPSSGSSPWTPSRSTSPTCPASTGRTRSSCWAARAGRPSRRGNWRVRATRSPGRCSPSMAARLDRVYYPQAGQARQDE